MGVKSVMRSSLWPAVRKAFTISAGLVVALPPFAALIATWDDSPMRPTPYYQAVLAPLAFFRPAQCGARLANASPAAAASVFLFGVMLASTIIVALLTWEASYSVRWVTTPTVSTSTTQIAGGTVTFQGSSASQQRETVQKTPAEVWRKWHAVTWFGPPAYTLVASLLGSAAGVGFLAWLVLPLVHRAGPASASYRRAFRAVSGIIVPAALAISVFLGITVAVDHAKLSEGYYSWIPVRYWILEFLRPVTAGICLWLFVLWLGKAAAGARAGEHAPELTTSCEGCGYDLMHQPADGRCPECGDMVALSLADGTRRTATPWERHGDPTAWWRTTTRVLFAPSRFYQFLQMRPDEDAARHFARWHYLLIGVGAGLWSLAMILFEQLKRGTPSPPPTEILVIVPPTFAVFASLGCWLGHRTIAAAAVNWWILRGSLPDFRWSARVIGYEAMFLWVFCCFWGLLATSFFVAEDWISELATNAGVRRPYGAPFEFWVVLLGTCGIGIVWLWRYAIACRAIRWANF